MVVRRGEDPTLWIHTLLSVTPRAALLSPVVATSATIAATMVVSTTVTHIWTLLSHLFL